MKSSVDEARTVSLPQRHRLQFSISQLNNCPMTESPDEQKLLRVGRVKEAHGGCWRPTLRCKGACHSCPDRACPDPVPASSTTVCLGHFQFLHILMELGENEAIPPLDESGQVALA